MDLFSGKIASTLYIEFGFAAARNCAKGQADVRRGVQSWLGILLANGR